MRTVIKKYISIVLCMLLVFMYACSGDDTRQPSASDGGSASADTPNTQDTPPAADDPAPTPPAGDPAPALPRVFTVTFDLQNGDAAVTQSLTEGERAQMPSDPVRQGYVFCGWTAGGERYDFDAPVISDLTVTALWQEITLNPPEIDEIPKKLTVSASNGGVLKLAVKEQSGTVYTYDWYIDSNSDSVGGSFLEQTDVAALNLPLDHEIGDRYFVYCSITAVDKSTGSSAHTVSPSVEIDIVEAGEVPPPADTPAAPDPTPVPDDDPPSVPVTPPAPDTPDPVPPDDLGSLWSGDEYYSEGARALIATADAYVNRGSRIQYDDTRLVKRHSNMPAVYRHRHGLQSPELATDQHTVYTNCACFINTLIRETFDYDLVSWYTADFIERKDMTVFYYDNTGNETEGEKESLIRQVKSLLLPGDMIVTRLADESNGHIIMYVGNGRYVHSTGSNYNYSSGEVFEKNGSIRYDELSETYFNPSSSRYLPKTGRFAILRPLNIINVPIPQKTLNRMSGMTGIVAQKLMSHPQGKSANPGDLVSYTVSVENTGSKSRNISVTSTLPDNTTLVSGGDRVSGRTLSWSTTVAPGERYEVSYTVSINGDVGMGSSIGSGITTVNGIELYCADIYVANTLTGSQMAALDKAARAQKGSRAAIGQIINSVYTSAVGDNIRLTNEKALFDRLFSASGVGEYLNLLSDPLVVPALYGGWYVDNSAYQKDRIQMLKPSMLLTGDILLVSSSSDGRDCTVYLVLDGCELLYTSSSGAKIMNAEKAVSMMNSILGKNAFCVLRPSLVF